MKKVFSAVLALVLAFSMTVCAFAAPSPTSTTNGTITSATDADGNAIDVDGNLKVDQDFAQASAEEKDAVADIKTEAGFSAIADKLQLPNKEKLSVLVVFDARWIGAGSPVFPVVLEFKVAGLKSTSTAHVLHFANGAWEEVTVEGSIKAGSISGKFNSLSPVAVVVDEDTLSTTSSGDSTSPKTYDGGVTAAVLIALLAMGGVVLVNRKRYEA